MHADSMKEFDFSTAQFAQFLIKFSYVGTAYSGLAYTDEATPTIEREIFRALLKTRMIQDRQSCKFSRCGRTDSGVHAAGNYLCLSLRTGIDHIRVLNKVLPRDIRFLAIREVSADFNARFKCTGRCYKYFQPVWQGLDVALMEVAAQQLVGSHDFRNFCKMDVAATTNYVRCIYGVSFRLDEPKSVLEIEIIGNGFLWHQIRCIVAILLLIGEQLEEASLISKLLDLEQTPRKPLYPLADPSGLVLYDCNFEGINFTLEEAHGPLTAHRETLASHLRLSAVMQAINGLPTVAAGSIPNWFERRSHKPIANRGTGPSLDEKVASHKRKLQALAPSSEELE